MERKRWPVERQPVVRARNAKGLAQPAGPRAQQPFVGETAAPAHGRKARRWPERADKDGAGAAFLLADEVEAPVNTVGAVNIGKPGRAEHHCVARSLAAKA